MVDKKSIDFLPQIFRTNTNTRFLNATVDQLIQEPNLNRIFGYVGRQNLSPSYQTGDAYIQEIDSYSQYYQLEPGLVINERIAGTNKFKKQNAYNYIDLLNGIALEGGINTNHSRLFANEYYNYEGFIDLDKLVNYSKYYWMPNGPNTLDVNGQGVAISRAFYLSRPTTTVLNNLTSKNVGQAAYSVDAFPGQKNPDITLVRGGLYTFNVSQSGNPLWIQLQPGLNPSVDYQDNISKRDVFGVDNNGIDAGTITFRVPTLDAQSSLQFMNKFATVDFVSDLPFNKIQNADVNDFFINNSIDSVKSFNSNTIVMVNEDATTWWDPSDNSVIPMNQRTGIWKISVVSGKIRLDYIKDWPNSTKIFVNDGRVYGNLNIVKTTQGKIIKEPNITAGINTFYYQDGVDAEVYGKIIIIDEDPALVTINVNDIVGQKEYISPNGIVFTNGLKVKFTGYVTPNTFKDKEFIVEGVGKSIKLVDWGNLVTPDPNNPNFGNGFSSGDENYDLTDFDVTLNAPSRKDYIVINRSSIDGNPWSRTNRWFHEDVISYAVKFNNSNASVILNNSYRAIRPIIEFDPNLQLWNYGNKFVDSVNAVDVYSTDIANQIEGHSPYVLKDADGKYYSDNVVLETGVKVIFLNEKNDDTRNKIYQAQSINPHTPSVVTKQTSRFEKISSSILHLYDVTNLLVNMAITGTNIPENTVILTINSDNSVTLNNPVTDDVPLGTTFTFTSNLQQVHLVPIHTMNQDEVIVAVEGTTKQNTVYWWNNNNWQVAQQKQSLNQSPQFDIFNLDGISLGDLSYYPSTTFAGSSLFGYKIGTGTPDVELGIALSYRNIGNIGDIQFENYYDSDQFHFNFDNSDQILNVSIGYVHEIVEADLSSKFRNNWVKITDLSKQYIERNISISTNTNNFIIDIGFVNSFTEKNIFVYVNEKEINRSKFELYGNATTTKIVFNNDLMSGDSLTIKIFSINVNVKENYSLPKNLVDNSINDTFSSLTLGQIRNHLQEIASNSLEFSGNAIGSNNFRDIDYKVIPGKILQHSAGAHIAQMMFNNETTNIIKAIDFNRRSYSRFKDRLYYLISSMEFNDTANSRDCLDVVLDEITLNSSSEQSFYYTDMIPYGNNSYIVNHYPIFDTNYRKFNLINQFDITDPYYNAVLVYQNNQQLLIDDDYIMDGFNVVLSTNLNLQVDDVISIYEYNNTQGCMIPATPTKLGLYPKYSPQMYLDNTYIGDGVMIVQGHDGSKNLAFGDYRDDIILEFEKRIYNNISVVFSNDSGTCYTGVEPGAFRNTDYDINEWTQLLSQTYLSWAGSNNVNVFENLSDSNNPFTYNYSDGKDKIFGESIPGHWRGIYKYFYDTDRPHTHPWEMLGITVKPTWWEMRYGPAPYSSGNIVLWEDLEMGLIYQYGTDSYVDSRYARPNLSMIIPVNEHGELLAPNTAITSTFNTRSISAPWRFGDQSPQETAWRRSSDYPFAVQIAWALARPAQFCSMTLNRRDIVRITSLDQIINIRTSSRQVNLQITDATQYIPGSNIWIRDRLADLSMDITINFEEIFQNFDLNLVYKLSGYTDKSYLTVVAEQASPNSNNSGIIVPQENYDIVFTKSAPIGDATYSAIIIEKTGGVFTVYGFDTSKPYFTIIPRRYEGESYAVSVSSSTAKIYSEDAQIIQIIPYGTQFSTKQQVVDFIISYGHYLNNLGFQFSETSNEDTVSVHDWTSTVREFLFLLEQGWADNNTVISLTPAGTKITFDNGFGTVDDITNSFNDSRIINSDGKVLQRKEYVTYREGTKFSVEIKDKTKGIHLIKMNVVQYEHTIVFDNTTVFNDVIYQPSLGNRQNRLKISGYRTRDWNGSLYAPGFLINHRPVDMWMPMQDYYKGDIVEYKNKNYTAKQFIPGTSKFEDNGWYLVDSKILNQQLIMNLASGAEQFEHFYDVDQFDINRIADSNARNSTGFVPRSYMSSIGLDNISQHKFYLGMIREKGTQAVVDAFMRARLPYLENGITLNEQWAIRLGNYGGIQTKVDVELSMKNAKTYNGGYIVELINSNDAKDSRWNTFTPKDLLISPPVFDTNIFKASSVNPKVIATSGPVLTNEVDATVFDIQKIQNINDLSNDLGEGSRIWVASNKKNEWDVFRITADTNITILSVTVVGNELEFNTDKTHDLAVNDNILLKNGIVSKVDLSGFYRINSVLGKTFRVPLYSGMATANGKMAGKMFKLKSVRYDHKGRFALNSPGRGWIENDTVWIDGLKGNWETLENTNKWNLQQNLTPVFSTETDNFGNGIDIKSSQDLMIVGAPSKDVKGCSFIYRQNSDNTWSVVDGVKPDDNYALEFGYSVKYSDNDSAVVGAPSSNNNKGLAYILAAGPENINVSQVLNINGLSENSRFGESVTSSRDGQWVAIGAPGANKVFLYRYIKVDKPSNKTYLPHGETKFQVPDTALNKGLNANDIRVKFNYKLLVPYIDYTVENSLVILNPTISTNKITDIIQIYFDSRYSYVNTVTNLLPNNLGSIYRLINNTVSTIYFPLGWDNQGFDEFSWDHADSLGNFGSSISFSVDGSQLLVGAPNTDTTIQERKDTIFDWNDTVYEHYETLFAGYANTEFRRMGISYVFNHDKETFFGDGKTTMFPLDNMPVSPKVFVDGIETNAFFIVGDEKLGVSINFEKAIGVDSIITVETNVFDLLEIKLPPVHTNNLNFGSKVLICPNTCSLYIGTIGYNAIGKGNGAVYRFVNTARTYGTLSGQASNPIVVVGQSIRLNGVRVTFTGTTLADVVSDINSANIPGVTASITVNAVRQKEFLLIKSDSEIAYNKLNIGLKHNMNTYIDLGINIFDLYQTIVSPVGQDTANFGNQLTLNSKGDRILIGANSSTNRSDNSFDDSTTTFDVHSTKFITIYYRSGSAYLYEYQGDEYENPIDHGNFAFAHLFSAPNLETSDYFSTGVALSNNWALITALNSRNNAGTVYSYYNNTGKPNWETIRKELVLTDSRNIERIYLYNDNTKLLIAELPVIDPEHGIPVPSAAEQIRYIVNYDPAVYTNTPNGYSFATDPRNAWASEHVGELWWDTNQIKYNEWNQGDLLTRYNNWGVSFPNSFVSVYEWIESDVSPSLYTGTSGPLYTSNEVFTSKVKVDAQSLQSTTKYYFWVANSDRNDAKLKRSTAIELQDLINNPRNINDPFAAIIGSNSIALYNCQDIINDDINLHISLKSTQNSNPIHSEWAMFDDGSDLGVATEFLDRLNDSMAGQDAQGRVVPDERLSVKQRYGISIRPRQTTFIDKFDARKTWINNVNSVFAGYPIVLLRDITPLFDFDPVPPGLSLSDVGFDTIAFNTFGWDIEETDISDLSVNTDLELDYLNKELYFFGQQVTVINDSTTNGWTIRQLAKDPANIQNTIWQIVAVKKYDLRDYWTYADWYSSQYNENTPITKILDYEYQISSVDPQIGDIFKIKNGSNGNWKLILVKENSIELIGQQNATVQFNSKLYDIITTGFSLDSQSIEIASYAKDCAIEFRKIFDIVNYQFLTKEFRSQYKDIIRVLIDKIATQFKQNDWLLKTSFIDVKHNVRSLDQIPVYVKEPESIINDFISEVKPYHTKIKQYVSSYDKTDLTALDLVDFDLPSYYSRYYETYRQPELGNPIDMSAIGNLSSIQSINIVNPGRGYSNSTAVIIEGDGTGAEAIAINEFGSIIGVEIIKGGTGYNYATIKFAGTGTGAAAFASFGEVSPTPIYSPWLNNHKYGVEYIEVSNGGQGYDNNTVAVIEGDGNEATAVVYTQYGKVTSIEVTNSGFGYTNALSYEHGIPIGIKIVGSGTGARAYAKLSNGLPRTLSSTIKFDRFTYSSMTKEWAPNTVYNLKDIVTYKQKVYRLGIDSSSESNVTTIKTGNGFTTNNFIEFEVSLWKPNQKFSKNTIIVYHYVPYVALIDFTSSRTFEYNEGISVTNSIDWQSTTFYKAGTVLNYQGIVYHVLFDFTSPVIFTVEHLIAILPVAEYPGGYFDDAASRVWAYYNPTSGMPGKDLAQVMTGIDYPGVNVRGPGYEQNPGFDFGLYEQIGYDLETVDNDGIENIFGKEAIDTNLYSLYTDTQLGMRPEDMITDGGAYFDSYSSHAPEELIPGHTFDSLSLRVKTLGGLSSSYTPGITVISYYADGNTFKFSFDPKKTNIDLPVGGIENIIVYNDSVNVNLQFIDTDYTVNWQKQYIEFVNPPSSESTIIMNLIGNSGKNLVAEQSYIGDGVKTEFRVDDAPFNIQQAYIKINNVRVTDWILMSPEKQVGELASADTVVTNWAPATFYSVDSYVRHNSVLYRTITDHNSNANFDMTKFTTGKTVFVRFDTAPTLGEKVEVHLFDFPMGSKAYSEVKTEIYTVPDNYIKKSAGYTIALPETIQFSLPYEPNVAVLVNGKELEPSNQTYYVGNNITTTFAILSTRIVKNANKILDSDISVFLDGNLASPYVDYTVNTGNTNPKVTFKIPPSDGTSIVISNRFNAAYAVFENTVVIKSSATLKAKDKIAIRTISTHDQFDIRCQVYSGFTGAVTLLPTYILSRPVASLNNIRVTVDGIWLSPFYNFNLISPTKLRIDPQFYANGISSSNIVVISHISEDTRQPDIEYQIFKGTDETFEYIGIGNKTKTRLLQDLAMTDTWIYVEDVTAFTVPNIKNAKPGVIFVNGERITFTVYDNINNRLGQLRRATNGTGAAELHPADSIVHDGGFDVMIPSTEDSYFVTDRETTFVGKTGASVTVQLGESFRKGKIWLDPGRGTPANGLGLTRSTTAPVQFLKAL